MSQARFALPCWSAIGLGSSYFRLPVEDQDHR